MALSPDAKYAGLAGSEAVLLLGRVLGVAAFLAGVTGPALCWEWALEIRFTILAAQEGTGTT